MKKWLTTIAASALLAASFSTAALADESNDKDCSDFSTYDEVVNYWNSNGYTAQNDPENLDGRGKSVDDGIPCEAPGGYDTSKINGIASKEEDKSSEETEREEETSSNVVTKEKEEESVATSEDKDSSSEDKDDVSKEEGEKLPETASNGPLMMLLSAIVTGLGLLLFVSRKKVKA